MNVTQPVSANRETLLTGRETSDTSIRNIGANVVYLNDMTDVTPNAFPLYPGDVATWAKGESCYAICPGGGIVVLSDKLANTLGLGTVSATLPAGTSVAINNTVTVGISGTGNSVQVANSPNVGILGTPNVAVTGTPNVSVTNTPTVGISGTLNSVQVSNSPTVGISGTPNVGIATGLPDVTTYTTFAHLWDFNGWQPLGGRSGAGFVIQNGGNFVGSVQMLASNDGGSTAYVIPFYDPQTGAVATSLVCGSGQSFNRVAVVPPGASHVGLQVFAYTSGSVLSALTLTDSTGHAVLYGNPNMAVSNTPNVGITGTPNVALASGVPNLTGTATLNGNGNGVTLTLTGQTSAGFTISAGTLTGTVSCWVSYDNGAVFTPLPILYDVVTGRVFQNVVLTNPNGVASYGIAIPPGATKIAVVVSPYTSGTANITVTATAGLPAVSTDPRAATSLNPVTGTPGFANRNVSATSTASGTVSGGTATLIAAPGAGKSLELHGLTVTMTDNNTTTLTQTISLQLQRSDTGAIIWQGNLSAPGTTTTIASIVNTQVNSDFQGATLPPNVGVNIQGNGVANLNYTTVS